jgi:DNA-binding NarL/FixJ family response regulator
MNEPLAQPVRILLVDDHRIVREGLSSMLHTQPDLQVVGEAANGHEAIARIEDLRPDVVLLDLEMPELDGVHVLKHIRSRFPEVRVVVLTAFASDERILDAVRAGAKGYLLKDAGLAEVIQAIRTVATGGSHLEASIEARLLGSLERLEHSGQGTIVLTERERTILQLIARGYSNKTIGDTLHLAERTVKLSISIIFQKLGVTNRAEAVAKALQDHLIAP